MFAYLAHFLLADDAVGPRQGLEEEDVGGAGEVLAEELGHAPEHAGKARLSPEKKKKSNADLLSKVFYARISKQPELLSFIKGDMWDFFQLFIKRKSGAVLVKSLVVTCS